LKKTLNEALSIIRRNILNRLVQKKRNISNKIALIAVDLSNKVFTTDVIEEKALRHDFIIKSRG
jgi:hypothetical protein